MVVGTVVVVGTAVAGNFWGCAAASAAPVATSASGVHCILQVAKKKKKKKRSMDEDEQEKRKKKAKEKKSEQKV